MTIPPDSERFTLRVRETFPPVGDVIKSPALLIATGFLTGLSRVAPGTVGSIPPLLLYALVPLPLWLQATLPVILFILGYLACHHIGAHTSTATADPRWIVIDETAGQTAATIGLAGHPGYCLVAFVMFRLLDALKPPGIRHLDALHGPLAIMLDDLAAGLAALALTHILRLLLFTRLGG